MTDSLYYVGWELGCLGLGVVQSVRGIKLDIPQIILSFLTTSHGYQPEFSQPPDDVLWPRRPHSHGKLCWPSYDRGGWKLFSSRNEENSQYLPKSYHYFCILKILILVVQTKVSQINGFDVEYSFDSIVNSILSSLDIIQSPVDWAELPAESIIDIQNR